jgi:hypothetical protein
VWRSRGGLEAGVKRKIFLSCRESNLGLLTRRLVTVLSELLHLRDKVMVRLKSSLCLTNYHAMETYPVLD